MINYDNMKKAGLLIVIVMGVVNLTQSLGQVQPLPKSIKKIHFYAQPVYSEGSPKQTVSLDGTTQPDSISQPVYRYFLFIETASKKFTVASVMIDKRKYTYKVCSVNSPVTIDNQAGNKRTLVKKTSCFIFKLDNLKQEEPLKTTETNHQVVVAGWVNGQPFSIKATPVMLDPLTAQ